ncbi:hypothetical protein N0V82_007324 [Gnomoniopsis sp. IMI 355080]|nr:hypothetical protein N0V82_007324 [Gnomoniopsis sp. IMI 355080]
MATEKMHKDSVLIRLSVVQPGDIDYPERRIILTESEPTAKLGRSSSRPSLGLQPAVNNGWYNSPVMSRHHAELEADFTIQASTSARVIGTVTNLNVFQKVYIRDSGSMHGTFLNKNKVVGHSSQPTRIQVGDELTLGLPVFRNREEFQPAHMRVDGLEFYDTLGRPTTTPTRTFTVPDDCSTDDNEPLDETSNEPVIMCGTIANVGIADDKFADLASAPNPWADSHPPPAEDFSPTCHTVEGPSRQLDGAEDNSASSILLRRPYGLGVWSDVSSSNGSLVCTESDSAGPTVFKDNLTDSDDDDQDMDSIPDIGSGDDPELLRGVEHGDESRSPSWNSFSSDSEDEDMDNDSVLDDSVSEGFALFDDDSDDMVDETDANSKIQPETGLQAAHQTAHSLRDPSKDVEIDHAPVLPSPIPQLPPISSFISAGPNDWMPCPHPNWGRRSPSPSDAVLLGRLGRTDAASSEKVQGAVRLDTPDQILSECKKVGVDGEDVSKDHADLEGLRSLGQKSGKTEFFAARAVNKRIHQANTESERLIGAAPRPNLGTQPSDFFSPHHAFGLTGPSFGTPSDFVLAPHTRALTGEVPDHDALHQSVSAGPHRQSQYETNGESVVQAHADEDTAASAENLSAADTYTFIFEPLDQIQGLDGQTASVVTTDNHDARKGKRKAAEISEESPSEFKWASSSEDKSKAGSSAETLKSSSQPSSQSTRNPIPLPSPPPSPDEVRSPEQRPSKKIKKIAERVGYAALGGVSVGAMVLTSLIYTAPNFV